MKVYTFIGYIFLSTLCTAIPMNKLKDETDWSYVLPFTRQLKLDEKSPMTGKDVIIMQNLLQRCPGITIRATGVFDEQTKGNLTTFQKIYNIKPDGVFRIECAKVLLKHFISDGFKDDGRIPSWCKFKLYVPVHRDRNIETVGTLYDKLGNVLHKFPVRAHGGGTGRNLNQLTRNGNTPTGLSTLDLNSPEPIELVKSYGPYPVLRVVKGIRGNAAIKQEGSPETFLSNFRSGILLHTGIWDNWNETQPMPNSLGCLKTHPNDMKRIVDLLIQKTGAIVNKNPFGKLPYPYSVQGIIAIEQIY